MSELCTNCANIAFGQANTDLLGNPLSYGNVTFTWNGRRMATYTNGDTSASYRYNEDGVRTYKNVNGIETEYFVDGSTILAQKTGDELTVFYYDGNGKRIAIKYDDTMYYYVYNLQGDVTHLLDSYGNVAGSYKYDVWGNATQINGDIAILNPFRYRGYYYDNESGLYYLNSRYYNAEWGRFINTDDVSLLGVNGDFSSYNLFAYCGNNPIIRLDRGGDVWETVFDVASLGISVVEVCINPTDVWAWAGLVGDAVDLVPFVTGLGEATKAIKVAKTAIENTDNVIDVAKATKKNC